MATSETKSRSLNLAELKKKTIGELNQILKEFSAESASGLRKQDLIYKILEAQSDKDRNGGGGTITGGGACWRFCRTGSGSLRSPAYNYLPGLTIFMFPPSQIRRFRSSHRRYGER